MLGRHGWVRVFIRDFEGNPKTQYFTHKIMARFWAVNAVVAVAVFILASAVWSRISVLYLVLVSLYANWSTDAGAMAASEAAGENAVSEYAIGQETAAAEDEADQLLAGDHSQGGGAAE